MKGTKKFLIDGNTRKLLRQTFYRCLMEDHENCGVLTSKVVKDRILLTIPTQNPITLIGQEQIAPSGKYISSFFPPLPNPPLYSYHI